MQKFSNRNYLKAFFLASFAGTLWSFGALIVRYMEAAQSYQWQYLFFRALSDRHRYFNLSHGARGPCFY